jgi:hypothetical protein
MSDIEKLRSMSADAERLLEVLSRLWIDCDPNRAGNPPGSGFHPDDTDLSGKPRWEWFMPRAEFMIARLAEQGYEIKAIRHG